MRSIIDKIREDKDVYYGWQSNIAMCMFDVFKDAGYNFKDLIELTNKGAKKFLDMLIDPSGTKQDEFVNELSSLINKYSNDSGTPDFVLAEFMNKCLEAGNYLVSKREKNEKEESK